MAREADPGRTCMHCSILQRPGWESMPSSLDRNILARVGTLRMDSDAEPTFEEFHPRGTHGRSEDAPIATDYHPYNRCDVWRCPNCERLYLRYTEYGGYYEDERVRLVDPELVADPGS